ncbi:MAG: hypothetical protein ACE5HJ_01515 [Thermoplasmata archaeon]
MNRKKALLMAVVVLAGSVAGAGTYLILQSLFLRIALPSFPGELALSFLQPDPYSRIIVEVDWVSGQDPDAAALDTLKNRLITYTHKEKVDIVLSDTMEVDITLFSPNDLHSVETSYRDFDSGGDTLVLYVMYLPGSLEDSDKSLAVSYQGGSLAVFKEAVGRVARTTRTVSAQDVETSALIHELGHLFGLVNIVYQSDLDYEDQEHPFHSTNRSCVMYWAIETGPFLTEKPPTDFGSEASYDIAKLREGGYETSPSRLRESSTMASFLSHVVDVRMQVAEGMRPIFLCSAGNPLEGDHGNRLRAD